MKHKLTSLAILAFFTFTAGYCTHGLISAKRVRGLERDRTTLWRTVKQQQQTITLYRQLTAKQ
jgi:hypothetical protein